MNTVHFVHTNIEKGRGFVMTATKGLEGVIATQSSISSIIDDQLTYVGYKIDDLAENSRFEEVVLLLWNQKLPTQAELEELKQRLADNKAIRVASIDHLQSDDLTQVRASAPLRS